MKKTFRGLTLAAALLSASAATAEDNAKAYDGNAPVTPVAYIGDMPSASEDAYFAENAQDAVEAQQAVSQTSHAARSAPRRRPSNTQVAARPQQSTAAQQQIVPTPQPMVRPGVPYSPSPVQQMAPGYGSGFQPPVGYNSGCQTGACGPVCGCDSCCDSGYCEPSCATPCYTGCDSGCDSCSGGGYSGCGMSKMNMASMFGMCQSNGWYRAEALLWFSETRKLPPLVTASREGTLPIIGLGDTQTLFGNSVGGDLTVGYRSDFGRYFGDNIGIGARFWFLDESKEDILLGSDGSGFSVGRPFYDDNLNINNALLVGFDPGGVDIEGIVGAESKLNVSAAEAYARLNLTCSNDCQLDLLGGYSFFQIKDVTRIISASTTATSTRTFADLFDASNQFNGGQIGFESVIKRGKFVARGLTKVHLGNMRQRMIIGGRSIEDFDPSVDPTIANSGLYTMGNQGEFERDLFTFAPEVNLKLSYRPRKHLEVSAGYSLIYFDRVALSGINIDPTVDPAFFNTNGPFPLKPEFMFKDDSLWIQGVDLGVALTY